MKRVNFVAALALTLAGAAVSVSGAVYAAEKPPQISADLAKPLKAAQDAMKAKKFDEAITHLKEAQAEKGKKTEYDNYIINEMMAVSYFQGQQQTEAAPLLREVALSQYSDPDQTKQFLFAAMQIYYTQKNYQTSIDVGQEIIKRGIATSDIYTTIALAQQALGKNKEAAQTVQQIIDKQSKPEEKLLAFQFNAYNKVGDTAAAGKAMEQLVRYYPKPEYWRAALQSLQRMSIQDAHLQLNLYRLMNEVGVLTLPGNYSDMAGLALDQGYPGETVEILKKAFANNVFTEQRDQARYQHLLAGAQQRADADQKNLPQQEQQAQGAATGDQLVGVGAAYLTYGQPDKAATLIQQGIAKGSLKYPDEANLLLGVAQMRSHNADQARKAFDKVAGSSNEAYARLGKLWTLHAESVGRGGQTQS